MKIEISEDEYKTLASWYGVVYGECCLDEKDDKLMIKLAKKFKDTNTIELASKQDGT